MKTTQLKLALGAALTVGAITGFAQTPTPPNNVGVSEGKAAAAADKAVPRSDTGTLVRTGPTAADQARAVAPAADPAPTATPAPMQPAAQATPAPMRRAPKADRN